MHRTFRYTIALALALTGCAEQANPGTSAALIGGSTAPSEAVTAVPPTPSFDLGTAIERARAAFFEHDGEMVAGSETHRVELDARGGFAVTPAHDTSVARALPTLERSTPSPLSSSSRIEAARAFEARTESISRGTLALATPAQGTRTLDGAVFIARGAVVEELRNTADGLEQSWHFAERPAGQDDLVVRVATSGMLHVGTTETGEHFADSETGLGVRYGHGTFVDAAGARTPVPVRYEPGALVLVVPADVVDGAAYPAVLDPTIGPELVMDTPVTGPRGGNQVQPAVASNGSDRYLVVFTDGLFGDDDVRAARFDAMGTLLDGRSLRVAVETGSQQSAPAVSWNGTAWVVVWQDSRNGADWDVFGTTVSGAGVVATDGGAAIAATGGVDEQTPAIASAGAVTLLAYRSGNDTNADVSGMRLNATAVASELPFVIGGGAGVQDAPSVAATATQFLVAYDDDPDGPGGVGVAIRGRRLNASGTALVDAMPFTIATGAFTADVAWGGGATYLAVWNGSSGGRLATLAGTIPVTGTVTPPTGVVFSPGVAGRDYVFPRVAWNGSEYTSAFIDAVFDSGTGTFSSITINTRRLTATGATSGMPSDPTSIVGTTTAPDVAALGTAFYVVYVDGSGESSDIRGTRIVSAAVSTPTGQLLSSGPNDQVLPLTASNGTSFAVAWTDFRSGQVDVWASTISATGMVGTPVAAVTGAGAQAATGIAWSGSRYVVVYEDGADGNVRGFTMTDIGIAAAPFPIAISATLTAVQPDVACGPAAIRCLVSWVEFDGSAMVADSTIRAARVDASSPTPTVGAAVTVVTAAGNQFAPDVAAASTNFYVAWTDARTDTNLDVRGTRFLTSSLDVGGTVVGGAAGTQAEPSVASDGTDFVVVFTDQRAGGMRPNDVYLQRVSGAAGTLTGANVLVASSADDEFEPSIAYGSRYLMTWTRTNGTTAWIEGTRLETAGTIVDTTPLGITPTTGLVDTSAVSAGPPSQWLVAYRTFDSGTARTAARLVTDDLAAGAVCTMPSQCTSGFCVDGVCCAVACAGGTTDCNACSVAAGGMGDGMCTPIAGCGDAGMIDAPGTDAGMTDGAIDTDGGVGVDGGGDSGMGVDTGMMMGADTGPRTDSGGGTDGGGVDAGGGTSGGGCGCAVPSRTGELPPSAALGLLLGLVLVARRKR